MPRSPKRKKKKVRTEKPESGAGRSKSSTLKSEFSELDSRIRVCTLCRLSQSRTNAVPGDGRTDSPQLMLVGEAPGRNEDLAGKPFVGAGGKLLDSILKEAGIERSDVYITNIVKCRPPDNRKPLGDEVETCTENYLEKQIELLKPKLICTLGATALEYFTGSKVMGESRGKLIKTNSGRLVFPTYHPAAVFRNRSFRALLQQDMKKVKSIIAEMDRGETPTMENGESTLDLFYPSSSC